MRWTALLALLLAGCAVPTEEPSEPVPRLGWCPSWIQGPGSQEVRVLVDDPGRNTTTVLAPPGASDSNRTGPGWTHQGHGLDVYRLSFKSYSATANAQLRAFTGNGSERLSLRDYRLPAEMQLQPYITLNGTLVGAEFDVLLSSIDHDDGTRPAPLLLEWHLDVEPGVQFVAAPMVNATLDVTYYYRVCGV